LRFLDAVLLDWRHSGFSVHAGDPIQATQSKAIERVGRYLVRAPVSLAKVFPQPNGTVKLLTPPNPKSGSTSRTFDVLDWVHAITTQIPDARRHMVRYCGAYANRARRLYRAGAEPVVCAEPAPRCATEDEDPDWVKTRRRSWARLLRRIYELNPFVCPRCEGEMKIIAVITEPGVVDRILKHRKSRGIESPFEARAPPAA